MQHRTEPGHYAATEQRIRKVGFLFNHEQTHQIPHSATVGFELGRLDPTLEVLFITSSVQQYDYLMDLAKQHSIANIRVVQLRLPVAVRLPGKLLDRAIPFTKVMALRHNLPVFRQLEALVVPEKTSLLLRSRFGLADLKFIYTAHGAGDRAIGFDRETAGFDLIFLSGPKIERRMRQEGILDSTQSRIIGYPKFDAVHAFDRQARKFFDNTRPTVLYNPHFDPDLSSWYRAGREILEYFYRSDQYNLIFAPHVMLYTRRMHFSPVQLRAGWVKNIPQRYRDCPHMLIDIGSRSCTDMTYTLAADIYLGDVSSQIWEFLVRPRPCVFANVHRIAWKQDPNYLHWQTGVVFDNTDDLDRALRDALSNHDSYRSQQERLFRDTFETGEETASLGGARAIQGFLGG